MSETKTRNVLAIAAATVATGVLAYVVYFDYKRRNDAQFRRKLRKEKKRIDKTVAQEQTSSPSGGPVLSSDITPEMLRAALEQVKQEDPPTSTEEKETYFMTQVGMGEQLATQGPTFYLPAAIAFYKALRVYPSPVELIVIYQKTVPEPLFKLIIELTNLDVAARASGYYDHFPPKSMNVEIKPSENGRKVLLVTKDIAAGETIYKEFPVVAVLDADLEPSGRYCSHCFREIVQPAPPSSWQLPEDANPLGSTYCSEKCFTISKAQSTSLLFTQEPPLPAELAPPTSPALDTAGRKLAQDKFVEYIKREKRAAPLLVARFIARQVALETAKLAGKASAKDKVDTEAEAEFAFTDADDGDYLLADHMERLRYLEITPNAEELPLVAAVLEKTLPGLEQFVTDERHSMLIGKMLYNAIGVGSRDDKPESTARPEDIEKTRTSAGTQKQLGSALYTLSSYANHSCAPSAKLTFPKGTTELHVVATKDLKKGDEVSVAYVDVTRRSIPPVEGEEGESEEESVVDARRRRRVELARGWRFACPCARCEEEGKELTSEQKGEEGVEDGKDESKLEDSARKFEEGAQQPSKSQDDVE
ncbi:MAS20-domain-containing protein [Macrolepiota fuliginosa MF-IS2]|uniref:MAS20-domain-containing protein n=1 Tax=Macrolepiota fuliginosa MF-IS2 TaxID=1400762 RepID=A0A9P5XID7_9AGAR|nr:MAS20-domain-containing protein [Macrolepiota fuliginosa MF-IS2]